jgi:Transposase
MEACVGVHRLSRKLQSHGHDARLMPAKYVRPYSKGQKNDFRDTEAIAEAVQRPTMKFVATKTADQLDLQALHRVRERLVRQRTASSIRFVPSCWSAGLRCARVCVSCAPNCRASSPQPADGVLRRQTRRVDGLTWPTYEADLDRNLTDLHEQVHRGAYRALAVTTGIHS